MGYVLSPPFLPMLKGHRTMLFGRTKEQIGNVISIPARNASLLSLIALAVSLVTLLVVVGMRLH